MQEEELEAEVAMEVMALLDALESQEWMPLDIVAEHLVDQEVLVEMEVMQHQVETVAMEATYRSLWQNLIWIYFS